MEYAITVLSVAIFAAILVLLRSKVKPIYFKKLVYDEFETYASAEISRMKAPKKGADSHMTVFKSEIRTDMFLISRKRYGDEFCRFLRYKEQVNAILKNKFDGIEELPSIDGEARAVKLAKLALYGNDAEFDKRRVDFVLEEQMKRRTLCFVETEQLKCAFEYALVEKLAQTFAKLRTLAKMTDIADRYLRYPSLMVKKYKSLTSSRLFLSLCAKRAGVKSEYYDEINKSVYDAIEREMKNAIDSFSEAGVFDFSRYYTPLEALEKYDAFRSAAPGCKRNFLYELSRLSDRENLDEFMFALRLDKYMDSASAGHMADRRARLPVGLCVAIYQKRDISMLAAALSSAHIMELYFGENKNKKSKSIQKLLDFENTYEPIYHYKTINFGISNKNGLLKISPRLPKGIESADVIFCYDGTKNRLRILRGTESELYLGDTKLSGTSEIRLGRSPLDITVVVPEE